MEKSNIIKSLSGSVEIKAAIADVFIALITQASIDDISFIIYKHAKSLTESEFGYVGYIDTKTGYLVCPTLTRDIWDQCQIQDKDIIFKTFSGLWGWVLKNRKPLLTNTPSIDFRSSGTPPGHIPIHRFLSAPALIGETLMGQISIANAPQDYTEKDIHIIEHLASLYALAIERKRAEDALNEREKNLRLVIQNMPVMMDAFDKNGLIIVWNRECERVTSYRADEIVCNPRAMELLYPDDNYRHKMMTKWVKRGNNYYNWEWDITCKDGTIKTISWSNISERFPVSGWAAWGIGIDITWRKRALEDIQKREKELEDVNTALRVLLKQREEDKSRLEENILFNAKSLILPCLETLKKCQLNTEQRICIDLLDSYINEITSPFIKELSSHYVNFTPMEIRIASLIKEGKTTKEIAQLLCLSENTIMVHRHNIRSKLKLKNQTINLRSYLRSLN